MRKKPSAIRQALTMATCTLLSSIPVNAIAAKSDLNLNSKSKSKWFIDSAYLDYSEEGRVQVEEPVVSATKFINDKEEFEIKLTLDAMSGATPNGAIPSYNPQTLSYNPQTFSGPSGNGEYTTDAGTTPMREFSDQRTALNLGLSKQVSSLKRQSYGFAVSSETDYLSLGYNSSTSWDTPNRLTTWTLGWAIAADFISPVGGKPEELKNVNEPVQEQAEVLLFEDEDEDEDEGEGEDTPELKYGVDILVGVTQVITRRILMQFNYSHAFINGYLTDPYKVVSVIDPNTGEAIVTPTTLPNENKNVHLAEKRPENRDTNSLYWKTLLHIKKDTIRFSYRYFWDNWDVRSHTADIKYRFEFGAGFYIQPHYRYYQQSAADFYRHSLTEPEVSTIQHVSADFRLAEMTTKTSGLKIGKTFRKGGSITFRVEKMIQQGDSHPDNAVGVLQKYDLFPTLEATIVQISIAKKF